MASHCPKGGAKHKKYYVRLSPRVVQCLAPDCDTPFPSFVAETDKDYPEWVKAAVPLEPTQNGYGDFLAEHMRRLDRGMYQTAPPIMGTQTGRLTGITMTPGEPITLPAANTIAMGVPLNPEQWNTIAGLTRWDQPGRAEEIWATGTTMTGTTGEADATQV
mgnify:CR=1 FL=1